jgi:hypothetical protein
VKNLDVTFAETGPLLSIPSGVVSFDFEGEMLLFSEKAQKVYCLNHSASLIWSYLESQMTPDEVVTTVANTYGVRREQAGVDVGNLIRNLCGAGLLTCGHLQESCSDRPKVQRANPSGCQFAASLERRHHLRFNLLEKAFLVRCDSQDIGKCLSEAFAHLRSDVHEPPIIIDIVGSATDLSIYALGLLVAHDVNQEHVVPMVIDIVLSAAYRSHDCLIAIHAAVLKAGRECAVFVGESGAGKTSLSAALIHHGFTYFSDETTFIDRSNKIIPLPMSLRIKEGAWKLLLPMFPDLLKLRVHCLPENQKVRFLPPTSGNFAVTSEEGCRARWLISVRYAPGEKTEIIRICRVRALASLQSAGFDVCGPLDRQRIGDLLTWIRTLDCYEMRINKLEDAVDVIRNLVN